MANGFIGTEPVPCFSLVGGLVCSIALPFSLSFELHMLICNYTTAVIGFCRRPTSGPSRLNAIVVMQDQLACPLQPLSTPLGRDHALSSRPTRPNMHVNCMIVPVSIHRRHV